MLYWDPAFMANATFPVSRSRSASRISCLVDLPRAAATLHARVVAPAPPFTETKASRRPPVTLELAAPGAIAEMRSRAFTSAPGSSGMVKNSAAPARIAFKMIPASLESWTTTTAGGRLIVRMSWIYEKRSSGCSPISRPAGAVRFARAPDARRRSPPGRERRGQESPSAPGALARESSAVRESAPGSAVSTVRSLCAGRTLYPRILRRALAGNFKIRPIHLRRRRGFSLIERPHKLGRHQHHQLGVAPGERLAAE